MMMGKRLCAVLLAFVLLFGAGAYGSAKAQSDQEAIKSAAQSVLYLEARDDKNKTMAYGSGFVIMDNYTLVTSFHLVKDAGWVAAYNSSGDIYVLNKIIATDEMMDIALLEFYSPTNLRPLPIRLYDANQSSAGMTAIGGPELDQNTLAPADLSAVHWKDGLIYIKFEADLSQDMDGGVLVDALGQANGMIMGPVNGGQGTYEALDIQTIKSFAEANWKLERLEFYDYFHKDDAATTDEWKTDERTPVPAATPVPTEAPKTDTDYFLQIGDKAYWDKKDGYWQVNPKVVNNSKTLSADSFTLTFYCEDASGDFIRRYGDGDYYTDAVFDMALGPGDEEYPGYTWLDGYENVKYIDMAVSQIHLTDGSTIDIPPGDWQVQFIEIK